MAHALEMPPSAFRIKAACRSRSERETSATAALWPVRRATRSVSISPAAMGQNVHASTAERYRRPLVAGRAVNLLAEDVGVPDVTCVLPDDVHVDPAQRDRA